MQQHSHLSRIQEGALENLRRLTTRRHDRPEPDDNDSIRIKIVDAGGVKVIVNSLRHHPDVIKVHVLAFQALAGLANSADCRRTISDEGAIQEIVNSMTRHPSVSELQFFALKTIVFSSHTESVVADIVAAGGIELIISAMRQHPSEMDIQRLAYVWLHKYGSNDRYRKRVVDAGCVELILNNLKSQDAWLQKRSPKILIDLKVDIDDSQAIEQVV